MDITSLHEKVLNKLRKYCAYQERCQQEVRDKLYDEGLHKNDVEACIAQLIGENFVNEERFAIAYAGGKFRIKQWGKVKIRLALKAKKVSDYCINKAIKEISDKDYIKALHKNIDDYSKKVKEKDERKRKYKIAQHVISKGYEPDLVWNELNME